MPRLRREVEIGLVCLGLDGFRLFDLGVLSDQESSEQANVLGWPVDLVARRELVAVRDALDGRTQAR